MEYLSFGPALHKRRCEFMNEIASTRTVLILGDGDGRFTAEFLRKNLTAFVDSVEISESMSRLSAKRVASCPNGPVRVRQLRQDARTAQLAGSYDLAVAHFFLDCFTTAELEQLVPRVSARLNRGGRWLISEFQIPSSGMSRFFASCVVRTLYLIFGILTGLNTNRLPNYPKVLEENGYRRTAWKTGLAGMLVSEIWERV